MEAARIAPRQLIDLLPTRGRGRCCTATPSRQCAQVKLMYAATPSRQRAQAKLMYGATPPRQRAQLKLMCVEREPCRNDFIIRVAATATRASGVLRPPGPSSGLPARPLIHRPSSVSP